MVESYNLILNETRVIETSVLILILLGMLFFFFPKTTPLWFNGLFKPNRKLIKDSKIKFYLKPYNREDEPYPLFKFKHEEKFLELDKRLHTWLLKTKYRDAYNAKKTGVFYISMVLDCYRKLILSNIEDMVTNNLEISNEEIIRIAIGDYSLKAENLRVEFRLRPFFNGVMLNKREVYEIRDNLPKWARLCDEWHMVRIIQELIYKLGMIEVYDGDELIYRRYGIIRMVMVDEEDKVVNIGLGTMKRKENSK